jgi:hypothetical protein
MTKDFRRYEPALVSVCTEEGVSQGIDRAEIEEAADRADE